MEKDSEKKELKGFPVTFNIYAASAEEAEECRMAIIAFIGQHARQGRAVTAEKVARAVAGWESNPIVRNRIIRYFT